MGVFLHPIQETGAAVARNGNAGSVGHYHIAAFPFDVAFDVKAIDEMRIMCSEEQRLGQHFAEFAQVTHICFFYGFGKDGLGASAVSFTTDDFSC